MRVRAKQPDMHRSVGEGKRLDPECLLDLLSSSSKGSTSVTYRFSCVKGFHSAR